LKKLINVTLVVAIVMVLSLISTGCTITPDESPNQEAAGNDETSAIVFKDGFGREITLGDTVDRVAIGHSFFSEIMIVIGAEDKVVAVPQESTWDEIIFPGLSSIPGLGISSDGSGEGTNYEILLESGPDVYIVTASPTTKNAYDLDVEKLEPDVPVIALSFQGRDEIKESIEILGLITGKEQEAKEYIEFYEGILESITAKLSTLSEDEKPRLYYEMMPGWTVNDDCSLYNLQFKLSGGINIAGDNPQLWFETDKEWLAEQNPDVVVSNAFSSYYEPSCEVGYEYDDYSSLKSYVESIASRPEISGTSAADNNRIYAYYDRLTWKPRFFIGIAYMAKWLHPELFTELDPEAIHQEYLTKYLKIDYDLSKQGVFAYPEVKVQQGE